jgi:hypothetical protein
MNQKTNGGLHSYKKGNCLIMDSVITMILVQYNEGFSTIGELNLFGCHYALVLNQCCLLLICLFS